MANSLYFGNVDPEATEVLMYQLFLQFAPIKSLHMPKDRVLQTHQGFGFVEFFTDADTNYVRRILQGIRLYGRPLKISVSDADKSEVIGAKLFISNLNLLIDDEFLNQTFSKFGGFARPPEVIRDDNGELKGYGFVTYTDFDTADDVINQMNGKLLMDTKVTVEYARKEGTKGERHGDEVERLLVEEGKANLVIKLKRKRRKG